MSNYIQSKLKNNIGTIALDNYEKRNVLNNDVVDEIVSTLRMMNENKVKVVIITTQDFNSVWSAGHDVNELPKAKQDPLSYNDSLERLLRSVRNFPAPVIVMIHGSVWGGACDFVMNCDIVIADETCSFAMTPAKIGIPYNASGIQHFLNRVPINILKEMFFTAEPIQADRALNFGIINHVVSQEELVEYTYKIASIICTRSAEAIAVFKEQARIILNTCPINPETLEYIEQLRKNVYQGKNYSEGISAFLEKRKPIFD